MRSFILFCLLAVMAPAAAAADHPRIRQDIDHLLAICAAHPAFRAASIDAYDPDVAKDYETDFYETALELHARPKSLEVIDELRVRADVAKAACLNNIVNTWPG